MAFALFLLGAAAAVALPAQTLTTLVNFDGTNGANPYFGCFVQGTDGNLYGTTSLGGTHGKGTIFKITPTGTLTTLHNFNGTDGAQPFGSLVQATSGDFYGTTEAGGTDFDGTVFKITKDGRFKTLHSFSYSEGAIPIDGLLQATNGDLYGTTSYGGANSGGLPETPGRTLMAQHRR